MTKTKAQINHLKWILLLYFYVFILFFTFYSRSIQAERIQYPSYQNQQAWKDIQQYLPKTYQLNENTVPKEEWWQWRNNAIHLDTYRNPNAKIKVILFHGVGTNGRQMTLILGKPLADLGYETIAIDLPGYGLTQVDKKQTITYDDWVQVGSDLINEELKKDDRPIVLYGLSAGGMLTYHVASKNQKVEALVGMTFLDTQSKEVKKAITSKPIVAQAGGFMAHVGAKTPLKKMRLPMKWVSKMNTLVNNEDALKIFLKDKTSAGNSVSVKFLDSYLNYIPEVQPEAFNVSPILLTQPEKDRWTPYELSQPFLVKINQVKVETKQLDDAGHYPLEQKGLDEMVTYIDEFYRSNTNHEDIK